MGMGRWEEKKTESRGGRRNRRRPGGPAQTRTRTPTAGGQTEGQEAPREQKRVIEYIRIRNNRERSPPDQLRDQRSQNTSYWLG
jgi:hypothetical protein